MSNIKVLAYYLPQFHPLPENDKWWGKGFTEWVNVAKAKPLFRHHYQPKIPADLGFYDLRLPESRDMQAEYAKQAGVSAFCYWHYWFGKGKRLMNFPFDEVLRLKRPNFPFCLAWANHSWYQKSWTSNNGIFNLSKSKLLIEQQYFGKEDYTNHFYEMLPAFQDDRYFKINNRPVMVIFNPLGGKKGMFSPVTEFMDTWQALTQKEGLQPFFFIGHCYTYEDLKLIREMNFDAINFSMHHIVFPIHKDHSTLFKHFLSGINSRIHIKPTIIKYANAIKKMDVNLWNEEKIYPTIIPNWDHTPRSGNFGRVFQDSTPELFSKHIDSIFKRIINKAEENRIVFLKSWNEWGEGNYIEPDLKYGTQYIDVLAEVLSKYN